MEGDDLPDINDKWIFSLIMHALDLSFNVYL